MPLTRRMLLTHHMPQAAKQTGASSVDLVVNFDSGIQNLAALEAAVYRLIGTATCQIDRVADRYVCHLVLSVDSQKRDANSLAALKERFLNLVADENLRARVAVKTEGVRNVILALAFGSLATTHKDTG